MYTYKFKSIKDAEESVGGLSSPSKMPSYCWSISAKRCKVGAKLTEKKGSVCSGCYALKNMYMFPQTQNALENRYNKWNDNRDRFKDAMIYLMNNKKRIVDTGVFRWFDSGDIQGIEMLSDINDIAWASPYVNFWLPTKEYGVIHKFKKLGISQAPNLTIRISSAFINESSNVFGTDESTRHKQYSSVYDKDNLIHTQGYVCPSSKQDNECKECRACWNSDIEEVTYIAH